MIILISGKQGSGKTTLAEMIHARLRLLGKSGLVMKFAGPLYEMHDAIKKIAGFKDVDGRLLQILGTEWGRKVKGENFWVDLLRSKMPVGDYVVIDDCRFLNELTAFDDDLTFKMRLECDVAARRNRIGSKWREGEHESETALDDKQHMFDLVLDTTFVHMVDSASVAVAGILEKWQYDRGV